MLLAISFLGLAIIANLILGGIVLIRTIHRPYSWYFAATTLGIAVWGFGDILLLTGRNPSLVHLGAELFYIGPMPIPVTIFFFSVVFPENRKLSPSIIYASVGLVLAWAILIVAKLDFIVDSVRITSAFNVPSPNMPGFLLYAAHFSMFFMLTYWVLLKKLWKTKGTSKPQLSYTFAGVTLASILAMVTNLLLPIMGVTDYIWLGPILTIIFVVAVALAIIRHRLFDIRLIIARSLAYVFTLSTLVATLSVFGYLLTAQVFATSDNQMLQFIVTTALLVVASLTFGPIRHFFNRVTNNFFYRDAYEPQILLDEFNKTLVSEIQLDKLLKKASIVIQTYLKAEYTVIGAQKTNDTKRHVEGSIEMKYDEVDLQQLMSASPSLPFVVIATDYLDEEYADLKALLKKNDIAMVARLVNTTPDGDPDIGYIILGQKESGNVYNKQDIAIMEILANEMVLAVQNALRFEEIENFNITLQEKVEDATRRLRQTNEKLRQLDETKDEFISMASHQLRTPLTSVKGYVSMVLEGDAGKITAMQRKLLDQAFVSSQRMVYMIADLLNVSRLKTGKFMIDAVPTNLADVVEGEISQLRETAQSRDLTLTYEKPDNFMSVLLDETKIRQVIMNFVDNAIYYTPSGGTINVSVKDTGETVEFRVVDNGIGIPKHEQHLLFGKFFRANNAKKIRPDGTGLGLFMAKKVIVAQGGSLIFNSQEGKGSTFGFSFAKTKLAHSPTVAK